MAKASPALRKLFLEKASNEVLEALDKTDDGRAFRSQLDDFLLEFGWRSDAVYDLADIPWREDPSIALASIAALMELDDSEDPERLYQHRVQAREELLAKARAKLADDPEKLAKFDELYEAARYSFPLTEDHAFYIDQLGVGVFRRFVLAVGERLVEKGVFDSPDDVFFLYRDEVVDALQRGGDRRAVVAERRASLAKASEVIPPTSIGNPPPTARGAPIRSWTPSCSACSAWCRPRRTPTRTCSGASPVRLAPTPGRPGSCARSPRRWTSRRARSWCAR